LARRLWTIELKDLRKIRPYSPFGHIHANRSSFGSRRQMGEEDEAIKFLTADQEEQPVSKNILQIQKIVKNTLLI